MPVSDMLIFILPASVRWLISVLFQASSAVFLHFAVRRQLAGQPAESHRPASRAARQQIWITAVKVTTGTISGNVQSFYWSSLRRQCVHVGIDLNSIQRAKELAAPHPYASKRGLTQRRQTERFLAEILVLLLIR